MPGGPRVLRLTKPYNEEGVQGGSRLGWWTFQGDSKQEESVHMAGGPWGLADR